MHGNIGMQVTQKKRWKRTGGRKRQINRPRMPNGHVAEEKRDVRAVVMAQPHRNRFAETHRADQRAESYLGSLNLEYRISESKNANKQASKIEVGITDAQYLAGQKYHRVINRYLAMCNAPRLAQPQAMAVTSAEDSWRAAMKKPSPSLEVSWRIDEESDDQATTSRYTLAYEAVSESAGHAGHKAINRAVMENQWLYPNQFEYLRLALSALVRHFGIAEANSQHRLTTHANHLNRQYRS